jgi:chromosome segregation ATPase
MSPVKRPSSAIHMRSAGDEVVKSPAGTAANRPLSGTFDRTDGLLLSPGGRRGEAVQGAKRRLPESESMDRDDSSSSGRIEHQIGQSGEERRRDNFAAESVDSTEQLDAAVAALPAEAALRLQKARILALESELSDAVSQLRSKDDALHATKKELVSLKADYSRLMKNYETLKARSEKNEQKVDADKTEIDQLKKHVAEERKQREEVQKELKKMEQELAQRDLRMNRALEDAERYKNQLKDSRTQGKDLSDATRKQLEKATAEVRRLERVKGDLLTVVKKQMKLIDVLRRQKLHIEAARLLPFTEDEFAKLLDSGLA